MGSAGSEGGPCTAFRVVVEHDDGGAPSPQDVADALYDCKAAYYIEVHPAPGTPCEEVGHLQGDPCPRCRQPTDCDNELPQSRAAIPFVDLGCGGDTPCYHPWPFGQAEPPVAPAHVHNDTRCAWFGTVQACEAACVNHNAPRKGATAP